MSRLIKTLNFFILALMVLVVFSCSNVIPSNENTLTIELPSVVVSRSGNDTSNYTFEITITDTRGDSQMKQAESGNTVTFERVLPDTYTVTGKAFSKDSALELEGKTTVVVEANKPAQVQLELKAPSSNNDTEDEENIPPTGDDDNTEDTPPVEDDDDNTQTQMDWSTLKADIDSGSNTSYTLSGTFYANETITISRNVTIKATSNSVTIERAEGFKDSLFTVNGGGSLTLEGEGNTIVLDGKQRTTSTSPLITNNGNLTLTNCELKDNINTSSNGGAIDANEGTITITNTKITGNQVTAGSGYYGGGIYINGSSVTFEGSQITGNSTNGKGSGVAILSGFFSMTGGTVTGNDQMNTNEENYGVYLSGGNFYMSGEATVTDDNWVYINTNHVLTINGPLTSSSTPIAILRPGSYGATGTSTPILKVSEDSNVSLQDIVSYFAIEDSGYTIDSTTGNVVLKTAN